MNAKPEPSGESQPGDNHVVMMSSGVGSAVAAKRVAEVHGTDNLTLLFADVNMEDPDNYRFLREATAWVGGTAVVIDNDGKTIWDVFREQQFLGNTRVDLCSRVLKREPMRAWLEANHDPATTTVHLGFDISEEHRIHRAAPHWEPWRVEAPLCWEPVIWKDQAISMLAEVGIEAPELTRMGFPHANCGGGCVKAGIGQFTKLYHLKPDTFAEWEREEQAMRDFLGKDVSILRDRRFGKVRPLTLAALRRRIEDERSLLSLLDADEGDSCNCMGDYAEVPVTIGAPCEQPTAGTGFDCWRCADEKAQTLPYGSERLMTTNRMFVCATCGNKRCPKATDHRNACSGSNESGQVGSIYVAHHSRREQP